MVGIEAFGSPITLQAIRPPLTIIFGLAPKNAIGQSTMSASLPGSSEPTSWAMPWVMRRVDRQLGEVAQDAEVVVAAATVPAAARRIRFILSAVWYSAREALADPAHRLRVRRVHREDAEVVQHVLGGDRLGPDAALGERHVLRRRPG